MGIFDTMAKVGRVKDAITNGLEAIRQIRGWHGMGELEEYKAVQAELIKMFEAVLEELP